MERGAQRTDVARPSTRTLTTQVYFSTVVRGQEVTDAGEFVHLDWRDKRVLASVPAAPRDTSVADPNPRGGRRGGRGMFVTPTAVYGVTQDEIHLFDRTLAPVRRLSNGLLADLHEVHMVEPGRLWVAATVIDAALEIDLADGGCTRAYWPREDPRLQEALGLVPKAFDKDADHRNDPNMFTDQGHLHLNALATWRSELHALFNRLGVIVNLERGTVVARHPLLYRAHNLVVVDDSVFVSASRHQKVCEFDLSSGALVRALALEELDWVRAHIDLSFFNPSLAHRAWKRIRRPPPPVAKPLFARGLQVVNDTAFVGVSPASILCIDWSRGRLLDAYQHSDQVTAAVHGLQVVPPNGAVVADGVTSTTGALSGNGVHPPRDH